jgi:Ni2+-binding GTPase involved in maturation of urease and hydrogenase
MARTPADQPYNVILAGPYGVGKSSLFQKLSGEVHADYQYSTVAIRDASDLQFCRWTHEALVSGDTVKVSDWEYLEACYCMASRVSVTVSVTLSNQPCNVPVWPEMA